MLTAVVTCDYPPPPAPHHLLLPHHMACLPPDQVKSAILNSANQAVAAFQVCVWGGRAGRGGLHQFALVTPKRRPAAGCSTPIMPHV